MSYNKLKSLVANVEAIETAMKIQVQGRQATAEEKEILSRYSGFGGIKEVLNIGTDKPIGGDMQEPIQRLQELINAYPHFTEPMRHNVIEGIKASVLTAFYTPKFLVDAVVRQIHATFSENGLKMRSFLEPSAGIGGFLPIAMSGTYDYAIEKDLISGMILSLLHENTLTRTAAFETIGEQGFEHTTFDVIASNIPFGNFRVFDAELWKKGGMYEQATKTIHNYFFVKAMELLNEAGLLAFITSRGIADTPGNKFVREYLVNHADLISAIRLPDMLFMQTSGIEVGSDLLIFQKHTHKTVLSQREQLFLQVGREKADAIGTMTEYANKLFTMPKTTLATGSRIVQNQYGKYVRKYQWQGNENAMSQYLAALLKLDFGRYFRKSLFTGNGQGSEHMQMSLFGNVAMKQVVKGKRAYTDGVEAWMKDGAMVLFEGQVGTILCTIFCMCAYLHAAAICSDSISDKFSYKVLENFNYCWDNNIVYEDTNSKDTALFVSSHKYIISPILNAFCNNVNEQTELAKIGYCCKHYLIKVPNKSKKNIQYYSIEINILSNIKSHAPITSKIEELKKQDYAIIDIISEAPVMCLVFVEADYLVAVTYNMFYDFDDVLSFSKFFVKEHFSTK